MSKDQNIKDELLVKYLLGEASVPEQEEVQAWVSESDANRKLFEDFKLIWNESKKLAAASTLDENAAWERFKQRTEHQAPRTISLSPSYSWMRAAAILILLVGGGWMAYNFYWRTPEMITVSANEIPLTDTLPDGSVVTLNKASSISYPERFAGTTRPVKLQGEAFFSVTPDKSKPFTISVKDVQVQVVGTTFNVKSTAVKTEVIVETGVVQVSKHNNGVKVLPHEKAIVLKDSTHPSKEANTDELYNYYRTKEFICNGTPLWRLVNVLNEAFHVNIIIANDKIKNLQLTTTFRNESLDNILNIVAETLHIQVEKNGGRIILK